MRRGPGHTEDRWIRKIDQERGRRRPRVYKYNGTKTRAVRRDKDGNLVPVGGTGKER